MRLSLAAGLGFAHEPGVQYLRQGSRIQKGQRPASQKDGEAGPLARKERDA